MEPSPGGTSKKRLLMLLGIPVAIALLAAAALVLNASLKREAKPVALSSKVAQVSIDSRGYTPSTVKVKVGQQITWTNTDGNPHRLMADQAKLPEFETPEILNQGDSYTYIFDKGGKYNYYDPDNPRAYNGTVVVE